jgi:glucan endo-1,3-alpha-glucosidase
MLYDGKMLLSTFAGQQSDFGHKDCKHGWRYAKQKMEAIAPVWLVR